MSSTPCPICANEEAKELPRTADGLTCQCPRCGKFSIAGTAIPMWAASTPSPRQIANASGWIRDHPGVAIGSNNIEVLLAATAPTVAERADRLLIEIAARCSALGERGQFDYGDPGFLGATWCESSDEVYYLLITYLDETMGFYKSDGLMGGTFSGVISPMGYHHLDELRHSRVASNIGFCAMWFGESAKPAWTDAIEPAIRDAGYYAKRIDNHEHNNRIDDEILAMIRRSKFVVADFTGQRGGVYFEAGFALGMGLPVVWTCSKKELEAGEIHFDNRQYAFVTWEADKLDDFRRRLQNRVEATIGRGPLVAA